MNKSITKGQFLHDYYHVETEMPDLVDEAGNPTKFAEAAKFWGEPIPKTRQDVDNLASKGQALIATQNFSVSQQFGTNAVYGGSQELSVLRANQIKVPFVKKGSWKHDVYGKVEFEDKDIEQLISNFQKNVLGFTPYLTLGHLDEEPNSTDSHRKRGDLEDIVIEGDTAFGIFSVPDDIYQAVQKGEYEYSSGEFNRKFTAKDSGTNVGTTVIRVALTNSPFLPFGNQKVQALSEDAESCPETKENYVFLLSLDTTNSGEVSEEVVESAEEPKEDVKPEVELKEEVEKQPVVEEQPSTEETKSTPDIENTNLNNNESIMSKENTQPVETQEKAPEVKPEVETKEAAPTKPETAEVKEVEVKEEPAKVEKGNQGDVVLANLTTQLQKVQEMYQTQLEAANKTISALTDKVDALTDKLAGQETITQAFSTSMSQAQENAMVHSLQANGVLPANITKFLAFKNAFENADNKNIVKFSVGSGDQAKIEEKNVIDSVAELLISASNQAPLVEQQLGISAGRKTGAFDFSSIIEQNKAAAEKFQTK